MIGYSYFIIACYLFKLGTNVYFGHARLRKLQCFIWQGQRYFDNNAKWQILYLILSVKEYVEITVHIEYNNYELWN